MFRLSVGDMETYYFHMKDINVDPDIESNAQWRPKAYFIWIVWLIAAFTTNIIFLNFIIAVISDSYAKVMKKIQA